MNNLFEIYSLFIDRLPINKTDLLPGNGKNITFLNPYSMFKAKKYPYVYLKMSYIASDGILPLFLNSLFGLSKSPRLSFDMSTVAKDVFNYAILNGLSIYFLGAYEEQIERFILKLRESYPKLKIAGYHHGYIKDKEQIIINHINVIEPDIIVVGLGTPYQDIFTLKLRSNGFLGTIYTCGGFIHQGANNLDYFNGLVNRLHLRALYRMYKEPYVIKRVLLYYPLFIVSYIFYLFRRLIIKV
jgi:N-acetylglucosaminyldiphosphoundecaprenol N-acetyl-beta-D-mannosaminyltransferase